MNRRAFIFGVWLLGCALSGLMADDDDAPQSNVVASPPNTPLAAKIKGVDADNHTVIVNKPGQITLLLGTSEDSQKASRLAGEAMYPFQGRPDFQLIVVVDLRDSIANWVPSMVIDRMKAELDQEAIRLKPYFLKNGNKSNPRDSSHVIPDFNGSIFPQLGWSDGSDELRGILFNADGREIKRWSKIRNMNELQKDVHDAIEAFILSKGAKPPGNAPRGPKSTSGNP